MMQHFRFHRFCATVVVVVAAVLGLAVQAAGEDNKGNITVVNGQVYTPGLAIVDAPQPFTPLGGDTLQIAIDVSGDGRLPWPPSEQSSDSPTLLHSITIFLTSYTTVHNFTISNGTTPSSDNDNAFVDPVLSLEPSSTVKHVNWRWPACLVGDGGASGSNSNSARGDYNISIHQSFRWNGTEYYTVFDLPVSVTNSIPESDDRVECPLLENVLLPPDVVAESVDTLPAQPFLGDEGGVSTVSGSGGSSSSGSGDSLAGVLASGAAAPGSVGMWVGLLFAMVAAAAVIVTY
ncbi:hypothetical protein M432DRAFT_589687 [Thermoascus aurantiacus ATCC 26904]